MSLHFHCTAPLVLSRVVLATQKMHHPAKCDDALLKGFIELSWLIYTYKVESLCA